MSGRVVGIIMLTGLAACGRGGTQYSGSAPTPDEVYGQCAFCHTDLATEMTDTGGHGSLDLKCPQCHEDLTPGFVGCGHESLPRCPDCHTEQITHHDPAVSTPQQCTMCHTPHGSPNILLVRAELPLSNMDNMTTPCSTDADCLADQTCASTNPICGPPTQTGGCAAPITFTNLMGKADGSFASATDPGTGVCEVCHTTTKFYTSNGMGQPHFTGACYTCHPHARSFLPTAASDSEMP